MQRIPVQEPYAGLTTSATTRASEVSGLTAGFETPVKLKTYESGTLEELEPLNPLNFVQESPGPGENCLTSALGRSLSQKNEIWNLGSNMAIFGDFCTQASIFGCESNCGVPA